MQDRLVIITRFANSAEAHMARLALEAEGIKAKVGDGAAADMLSYMAAGLGGAKLLVLETDAQRAREILDHHAHDKKPVLPPWTCHQCGSRVDAGFEVCWSCDADYDPQRSARAPFEDNDEEEDDEDHQPAPFDRAPHDVDAFDDEPMDESRLPPLEPGEWRCPSCGLHIDEANETCPACGTAPDGTPNPYATVQAPLDPDDQPSAPYVETPEISEAVLRAWRAAIFGFVICPGVLHLYSALLLLSVSIAGRKLTPKSRWRYYVALVIDVPFLLLLLFFLLPLLKFILTELRNF